MQTYRSDGLQCRHCGGGLPTYMEIAEQTCFKCDRERRIYAFAINSLFTVVLLLVLYTTFK